MVGKRSMGKISHPLSLLLWRQSSISSRPKRLHVVHPTTTSTFSADELIPDSKAGMLISYLTWFLSSSYILYLFLEGTVISKHYRSFVFVERYSPVLFLKSDLLNSNRKRKNTSINTRCNDWMWFQLIKSIGVSVVVAMCLFMQYR